MKNKSGSQAQKNRHKSISGCRVAVASMPLPPLCKTSSRWHKTLAEPGKNRTRIAPKTFNFNPDASRVRINVELLDSHPRGLHTGVLEAQSRNSLGECLHQIDVARRHQAAHRRDHLVIADHVLVAVGERLGGIAHRELEVD